MAPDLFAHAAEAESRNARRSDPETSQEAGRKARAFAHGDCIDIYTILRLAAKPMAGEEISDALGWNDSVRVMRRMAELSRGLTDAAGKITMRVERTTDKHVNRNGRSAFKYRVTA